MFPLCLNSWVLLTTLCDCEPSLIA